MKTLRRMDLEEMARMMQVIPQAELNSIIGADCETDCFWRCVAYLQTGDSSAAMAAIYAESYYGSASFFGSGMSVVDGMNYIQANLPGAKILYVDPSKIAWYILNNHQSIGHHAVIYQGMSANGEHKIYDPQNNVTLYLCPPAMQNSYYLW